MGSRKNRSRRRAGKRLSKVQPVQPTKPVKPAKITNDQIPQPAAELPAVFAWTKYGNALATAFLCLLVAVSYYPATMGGLVWDDIVLVKVPQIHSWSGLWDLWFTPSVLNKFEGHYWPFLYTTFWLENKFWGVAPAGYHIVNLFLHAAASLLLWHTLVRFRVSGAWFVAAVFALHPLHVESVAWVIGRKDILTTLFYLASVLAYIRFVEERRHAYYITALGLLILSLLSKSIAVTLPATLLLWHWWKYGRVSVADVARVAPFLLVGLIIMLFDLQYYKNIDLTSFEYSWGERTLIAARALWFYVGKLLWPSELSVIYPRWEISIRDWFAWGCLLASLIVLVVLWHYRAKTGRGPLLGVLFFAGTLLPALGFVDFSYMKFSFVADRYQYLSGIAVFAIVLGTAQHLVRRYLPRSWVISCVMSVFAVLVFAALGTITWQQSGIYRDKETFFKHIIAINPAARSAHYNLGNALRLENRLEEALAMYRISLTKRPKYINLHNNLALTLMALERLEEAEKHMHFTLKLKPNYVSGIINLGALRNKQGRHQESVALYKKALALEPNSSIARNGMDVSIKFLQESTQSTKAQPEPAQ